MIKDSHPYTVLVIEDNPGDYVIVEEFLAMQIAAPVIIHAKSFRQASDILSADEIFFEAILLDLSLPDNYGQKLVSEILQIAHGYPVIILTGYADISFSIQSISQGIFDYLVKDELNPVILYKSIVYAMERKKTISYLEESERRYSDLFHLNPKPMWVYDIQTLFFLDVNLAAIQQYGYSREEFTGMIVDELRPSPDSYNAAMAIIDQTNSQNFSFKDVSVHRKKDGLVMHVAVYSNNIVFKGVNAKLILANDISERIKYIAVIEKQNEAFREIAQMQSHTVRAPLAKMMGIVNLIKNLKIASPECADLLNHFIESGLELDTVIRNISQKTELANVNLH